LPSISLLPFTTLLLYAGTALFAASGAMAAAKRRHDIVTFVFFAAIAGLGGGTLRDLLLGQPITWVRDPSYMLTAVVVGALVWIVGFREQAAKLLLWPDALGLSAFTVLGAHKALTLHYGAPVAVLMGVLTATAGGIIRDITAGEPSVLLGREIYITAALLGAIVYAIAAPLVGSGLASLAGFLAGAALRIAAMILGWRLPSYRGGLMGAREGAG